MDRDLLKSKIIEFDRVIDELMVEATTTEYIENLKRFRNRFGSDHLTDTSAKLFSRYHDLYHDNAYCKCSYLHARLYF